MSRNYDVEVEVNRVPDDKTSAVLEVLSQEVLDSIEDVETDRDDASKLSKLVCRDTTTLCGGESPEEAHQRITAAVKNVASNVSVITKWHLSEWTQWDEEFGNEPESEGE